MSGFDFDLDALKAKAAELADKAGLDNLAAKAQEVSDKAGLTDVLAKMHAKIDADGDGTPDILEKVVIPSDGRRGSRRRAWGRRSRCSAG